MEDRVAKGVRRSKSKEEERVWELGVRGLRPPGKIGILTLSRARGDLGMLFSDSGQ